MLRKKPSLAYPYKELPFLALFWFFPHHIHFIVRYNQGDSDQMVKGWKLHHRKKVQEAWEGFHAEKKS